MTESTEKKTVAERAEALSEDVLDPQRQTADRDRGHAQVR